MDERKTNVEKSGMDGRSGVFDLEALQANGGSTRQRSWTNAYLCREGAAAPAGGLGVRIVDHELRARKFLDVVHFRAFEILHAQRIDQQFDAAAVEHEIVVRTRLVETEAVLETRAAAALDEDAQLERGLAFLADQLTDAVERCIGNLEPGFGKRGGGSNIHGRYLSSHDGGGARVDQGTPSPREAATASLQSNLRVTLAPPLGRSVMTTRLGTKPLGSTNEPRTCWKNLNANGTPSLAPGPARSAQFSVASLPPRTPSTARVNVPRAASAFLAVFTSVVTKFQASVPGTCVTAMPCTPSPERSLSMPMSLL